jgi:transposase
MNVQLHKILSDVTGIAGMAILRAIVQGERNPERLASLVTTRVKHGRDKFIAALTGHYRDEHVFALTQALQSFDFYQQQMKACDAQIAACLSSMPSKDLPDDQGGSHITGDTSTPTLAKQTGRRKNQPYFDLKIELARIVGSDVTVLPGIDSLTAQTIFSECGYQLAPFPNEGHFSSYLGLCSANNKTGGKVRSGRTRRVTNRAAIAFRVAAQSLHRSHSAIGAFSRRMRARLGPAKAITATAHKLAILFYRSVRYGQEYVELGSQLYEENYRQRLQRQLEKNAKNLGFQLVPVQPNNPVS